MTAAPLNAACPATVFGAPASRPRTLPAPSLATTPTMSSVTNFDAPNVIPPNSNPVNAPVPADHTSEAPLNSSRCPASHCPPCTPASNPPMIPPNNPMFFST
ncbi:hypothetical protein [Streptosporangium sp. NBC_01756]|uniref:hypothetical protein n=1 Tax=Streptosporangium sp. NBC_01756 TaxID=2975950 RepID=UPI002DD9F603|nr:hypothetical protein [Streptosporangium sp. NBC_01756]WSC83938.1 hypothetical protein OIE48_26520 [Streptosporangium sp. NBC_01756]